MGRKLALLVGINYPGTKAELRGCHNDVDRMHRCLVDRFGFDEDDIRVLVDRDGSPGPPPTGANIRRALARLVGAACPGDFLFFHFSRGCRPRPGRTTTRGTRVHRAQRHESHHRFDHDDVSELVQKVPDGCIFTIVSDSCPGPGGLLEKAKEQIGDSTRESETQSGEPEEPSDSPTGFRSFLKATVRDVFKSNSHRFRSRYGGEEEEEEADAQVDVEAAEDGGHTKSRSLPLSTLIEMLKQQSGKDDVDVGSIRMTLFNVFGEDASPKIKKFMKVMFLKYCEGKLDEQDGVMGMVGGLAYKLLKAKLEGGDEKGDALRPAMEQEVGGEEEVYAGTKSWAPSNGVLVSGCQSSQTSADATTTQGSSFGALSNAIQTILEGEEGEVTNRDLVMAAREALARQGYAQQPGLYCSDELLHVAFIC
ncbi:hypothetical protein CFC21_025639 [Triticum aestivum]|uniref:Peptidase C14 caspase domain-containing protein n=2 Tax=Triticum aestivum TaxID=4565 RepID=A0A9R1EJE0_WHEAT|nr:hypothetical protein CFC21_025639 [Triticum aestivum]